jgi:hypothetical protein
MTRWARAKKNPRRPEGRFIFYFLTHTAGSRLKAELPSRLWALEWLLVGTYTVHDEFSLPQLFRVKSRRSRRDQFAGILT